MAKKNSEKTKSYIKAVSIVLLSASMLGVFLEERLGVILGPLMAVIFVYLYFNDCSELVAAIIVVANEALGTIALGKISFAYLLLGLALIKMGQSKKIRVDSLVFVLVSAALLLHLYIVDFLSIRNVIYSLCFIVALAIMDKSEQKRKMFFFGVALTVVLIAIHTCITGGVEFFDVETGSYNYVRKGIIAVGKGDSNYSCLLLNIGIVCLWSIKKIPMWIKGVLTIPILYSISITLSTSGLLALMIVLVLGILGQEKKVKAVGTLLIVLLVIVIIFNIYVQLPPEYRLIQVDAYIERMIGKIDALGAGNIDEVTTGRTNLAEEFMSYFWSQPAPSLFLGGNSLTLYNGGAVPHNTYIGYLMQTGLIGTLIFFGFIILKVTKQFIALKKFPALKPSILLKIVALFFALNISLYQGSLWSMWMYILILL